MPKILVVRLSSLGDIVLTTPVYKNLKQAFPDSQIASAVKEEYSGVLEGNPNVDRIFPLRKGESVFSFIGRIRKENFDVLIDLHNNLRSNLISLFSNIPKIYRYQKDAFERRLFVKRKIQNPRLERHNVQRYVDAVKPLVPEAQYFPPEIFPFSKGSKRPPLRILIIQTAFLGDAVLTTPMVEQLKKALPQGEISLLCTPEIRDVFTGNQNLHEILVMDKRLKDRGVRALFKWGSALKGRFDMALIPHRSFRSAFLAWLAGIPKRVGFENSQGRFFLTDTASFDWAMHDSERNLKLLQVLGIRGEKPELKVYPSSEPFDLEGFCRAHGLKKDLPWVGMNAGSMWKTKRWIPEGFASVADRLIEERNCQVLLFGSEKDREAVHGVTQRMKRAPVDLCGRTDLKTLSALISRCSLFVTNDSGPMHLATAAGVPVVAIFGPTTKELGFFPYGPKSAVVELNLACRPCTLHGGHACPLGHFKCMKDLTPESVLEACRKFLPQMKMPS